MKMIKQCLRRDGNGQPEKNNVHRLQTIQEQVKEKPLQTLMDDTYLRGMIGQFVATHEPYETMTSCHNGTLVMLSKPWANEEHRTKRCNPNNTHNIQRQYGKDTACKCCLASYYKNRNVGCKYCANPQLCTKGNILRLSKTLGLEPQCKKKMATNISDRCINTIFE